MADFGSSGGANGSGDDSDQLRAVEAEAGGPKIDDQTIEGALASIGADIQSTAGGDQVHVEEVGGDSDRHTPVLAGRTLVPVGRKPVGVLTRDPRVHQLDPRSRIAGSVVTDDGLGGPGGSSGDSGEGRSGDPSRDPARGKDPVIVEDVLRERPAERVEFVPLTGSSRHDPITSSDLPEFVGEAALARLMDESPATVVVVMAVRKERLQQIALAEEEE